MKQVYETKLQKIFEIQKQIEDIHPFLQNVFPVAIVDDGCYQIYDTRPPHQQYKFIKQFPTNKPLSDRVRAAFPLEEYDNKSVCVVTGDIF